MIWSTWIYEIEKSNSVVPFFCNNNSHHPLFLLHRHRHQFLLNHHGHHLMLLPINQQIYRLQLLPLVFLYVVVCFRELGIMWLVIGGYQDVNPLLNRQFLLNQQLLSQLFLLNQLLHHHGHHRHRHLDGWHRMHHLQLLPFSLVAVVVCSGELGIMLLVTGGYVLLRLNIFSCVVQRVPWSVLFIIMFMEWIGEETRSWILVDVQNRWLNT